MDKPAEKLSIRNIFDKISPRDVINANINTNKLIYSVIGFLQVSDLCDNSLLISNLAYALSTKGLNVCVVDFKVFNPNMYIYLDCEPEKAGSGLIRLLRDDTVDYREQIRHTSVKNVYLVAPSPFDLMEEYFEFELNQIETTINKLKDMFDIILIDIPNIPPLEFFVASLQHCHMGFFTSAEKPEGVNNISKIVEFAESIGISMSKFMNLINLNRQNLAFDFSAFEQLGLNIRASLPLVRGLQADSLETKIYLRDNVLLNAEYKKELYRLVDILINLN